MHSPCLSEVSQICSLHGCCQSPLLEEESCQNSKTTSTSSACRKNFTSTTTCSFFPNTLFTDHESLPSLRESFTKFTKAYPQYSDTTRVDRIRAHDYYHLSLSKHICLDYIGIGLFSHLQLQTQNSPAVPTGSSSQESPYLDFPFFCTTHKSVNLKSQLLQNEEGSDLESAIKKRIMGFLNVSDDEYCMVLTANKSSAFKLVAESYPFRTSQKLLTVYDYKSEAVDTMISTSEKRGARVMTTEFKWPRLRIHSAKLRKMVERTRKKKKIRGLFVFPLQSRMTGASYSYQWMSMAQENGWHVLLDACALGPKDMDSFGLSLIRPDFIICSFYKVFGENPTGFGCLFVKKSVVPVLEASTCAGIINIIPAKKLFNLEEDFSGIETETEIIYAEKNEAIDTRSSPSEQIELRDTSEIQSTDDEDENEDEVPESLEVGTSESAVVIVEKKVIEISGDESLQVECRGLDHVDSVGLILISTRARCLINWLLNALMKLQHPNTETKMPLVRIYGPKVKFDRGPALAFNVYDWKGEKIEPVLIQKLADRSNISLGHGFLQNIWFSDKYEEEKERVIEIRKREEKEVLRSKSKKSEKGITVVTAALSFLANFEDVHGLWAFIARFLDADFVEKEKWRYTALNHKTVEI